MRYHDEWSLARIERTEDVTPGIRLIEFQPGAQFRSWSAGAHIRARVQVGGRSEVRSYSLVDTGCGDERYRIAVKRLDDGLGGSLFMWSLKAGDTLELSQAHNQFELNLHAPSYTLIAGGVGITALLGMARVLGQCDRPVEFFYAVRSRTEAAFADLLQSWLGGRCRLFVAAEGNRIDIPAVVDAVEPGGELYVCGPIGMLEAVQQAWTRSAKPLGLLRYETFAASGHYANQPFTAVLPRFGIEIQVPAQQSLLAALEQSGIEILADCLRGECGLCTVDILGCDSAVDHRDVFLSESEKAENRKLCACVSRPAGGRIEIDTAYRGTRAATGAAADNRSP